MNVVVNFLSTLVSDESNGSIKRMLSLCGEFERIAKMVIDKAEKESHSRKKRKAAPDQNTHQHQDMQEDNAMPPASANLADDVLPTTTTAFSPPLFSDNLAANVPGNATIPGANGLDLPSNVHGLQDIGQNLHDMLSPTNLGATSFTDQSQFTTTSTTSPNLSSLQQPFVPQDLWQIPMNLEWDWADMPTGFPIFDNGMDPGAPPHTES